MLVALGKLGQGHRDLVGTLCAKAFNIYVLAVHAEGYVINVCLLTIVFGLGVRYIEVYVIVGLTLLFQNLVKLVEDVLHLVCRDHHVYRLAVAKVDRQIQGQFGVLFGFVKDGTHGDLNLAVALVGNIYDHLIAAGILINDDVIGIVGRIFGIVGLIGIRLVEVVNLVVRLIMGIGLDHRYKLGLPTLEGIAVGCSLEIYRRGNEINRNLIAVLEGVLYLRPDAVLIVVLKDNREGADCLVIDSFHRHIRENAVQLGIVHAVAAIPVCKCIGMALAHPIKRIGSRCQRTVLYRYGHGDCFAVCVVELEYDVVLSDLENDLNRRTAGGLLIGKDVFIFGIAGCFKGIAILIGDDDLIDLVPFGRGYGHGHGFTGCGIFGRNLHVTTFGRRGSAGCGISLGFFNHVDLTKTGNFKFNNELAVLIGSDDLAIQLDHFTGCGILIINNDFLFGVCGIVCIDSDSNTVFNADIHRLAFNLNDDLILNGRITVFGRRFFARGVNGYVIKSCTLLLKDLLQLSDNLLHSLGRNIQLQIVSVTEVVIIIKALCGILLQILNDGTQRNGDLGSTFAVNTTNIYGDIVVILVLANGSVIIDGIVITGRGRKDCLVGCIGINGNQNKAPVLEGIMEVDIRCLFGSIDHRDFAPSDQRFAIQHTVNHPGYREVNTLTGNSQGQCGVGHHSRSRESHGVTVRYNARIGKSRTQEGLVNDRTVCNRKGHRLRRFLTGYSIGKQNVYCQRMLSYAVIICNRVGIVHHILVGSNSDFFAIEEIDDIISILGSNSIKNCRKLRAGSCEDAFYIVTVLYIVETVIAHVDIHLNVDVHKVDSVKDVIDHIRHHQLVSADPEGIIAEHTLCQSSEVILFEGCIEVEAVIAIIQRTDGSVIQACRDLIQYQSHQLLEMNAVCNLGVLARDEAEKLSEVTLQDQLLHLCHSRISADHKEVTIFKIAMTGHKLIERSLILQSLIGLLQNKLHLVIGQINADILTARNIGDGNGFFHPFCDLNDIRRITVKRKGDCPLSGIQTVGGKLYAIITKGLIGHAVYGDRSHIGEAVHGVVFTSDEGFHTIDGNKTAHMALSNQIQQVDQIIDGIAVHSQKLVAIDAQAVYARVDAGCNNIVQHGLDFCLERTIAREIHQRRQNLHVVGGVNVQRQHHSVVLFVDLGMEHLIDIGNAIGNIRQLTSQIGDRTRNDHRLVFGCGSFKESTRVPTNEFARDKTELRLGRIPINIHMAIAILHGHTVRLPDDTVGICFHTRRVCHLCLDKGNQLLSRSNLFQCVQRNIHVGMLGINQQQTHEDHVVGLAVLSQKRLQLGHILIRKMLWIVCIFLIQIIFYECCQRIVAQFKIFMSFKETLQVFQHSGCHLVRTGRKDGTYHDKS